MKRLLKKFSFYREGRYIWRSFVVYKKPFSYLWHRFVVGPRIRRAGRPFDRPVETGEYSLHILCSHRDVTMLLWMLASWYHVLPQGMAGQVYIHEDGSFTAPDRALVRSILPHAQIIDAEEADRKAGDEWLSDFPSILSFRLRSDIPLMRKLVDPYFTGDALYRLIMDTDILWFKVPDALIDCLDMKKNCATVGMRKRPMAGAVAVRLSEEQRLLNSGVVGYLRAGLNVAKLEDFLRTLDSKFYTHHVEQAGYAFALDAPIFLPDKQYNLKPQMDLVMRHYTGPDREKFWFEGVKQVKTRIL